MSSRLSAAALWVVARISSLLIQHTSIFSRFPNSSSFPTTEINSLLTREKCVDDALHEQGTSRDRNRFNHQLALPYYDY
jgi:hypothetical protein